MKALFFGFLKACIVYMTYFSILWCTAEDYKSSFDDKPNSLNGYILKFFVSLSRVGNLIYRAIQNLAFHIVCGWKIRNTKVIRVLSTILDMGLFTVFLWLITLVFDTVNNLIILTAGGWDIDFANLTSFSVVNISSYVGIIMSVLNGSILMSILGFFLITFVKFLYYAVIFGFLDTRMFSTTVAGAMRKVKKSAETQIALIQDGNEYREAIAKGSNSIIATLFDSLASCFYKFAGLNGVIQISGIVVIYTLLNALGVKIGLIKVDSTSFLLSVFKVQDILCIVIDMLISLGLIKMGQILVAENIVNAKPEEERQKIYAKATQHAEEASIELDLRTNDSAASDVIRRASCMDNETDADRIFADDVTAWKTKHKYKEPEPAPRPGHKSTSKPESKPVDESDEEWKKHDINYQREKMWREREERNKK